MSAPGPEDSARAVRILSRRSQIYSHMNKLISDPATRFSDNTIMGLNFAGLIESRLGSLASARKHLAAVRDLIMQRGGMKMLPLAISIPTCYIWNWVGLGSHAFQNLQALENALDVFKSNMRGIREWMPRLLNVVDDDGNTVRRISRTVLARYLLARVRIFSSFSPLYRFIGQSYYEGSDDQAQSHAALLWAINQILYEARDDYKQAIRFLDAFYRYIESADEIDPDTIQIPVKGVKPSGLKTITVLNFLGRVDELYLANTSGYRSCDKNLPQKHIRSSLRLWETVQVVELLLMLSSKSRKRVLRQLSGWLTGMNSSEVFEAISDYELEGLAAEIREAWSNQKRRRNVSAAGLSPG
jgi:hypothetical protein